MDPYNNLDLSLFPQPVHDAPTSPSPNDIRPFTSILPRPAETSFLPQGHTKMHEHASQMFTPFHNQSDGSKTSLYAPSPPNSVSPLPSHAHNLHASVPRVGHPCFSTPTPVIPTNIPRRHPPEHSRALSQPPFMPTTVVGGVSTNTSSYAWASQRVSAQSGLPPTIAQGTPLGLPGRFSETDPFYPLNMQNTLLPTYAPGDQSTPTTNPQFRVQPNIQPAISEAHTLSPGSIDMTAGRSSPTHGGSFPLTDTDDYFLSSPSSCSQEDLVSTAPSPGSPSAIAPDTPTQIADTQQGISPAYLQPVRMQRGTSKCKGVKKPKDLKATRRLQGQRRSDNENIEALRELFVPKEAEVKWKKDRLGTILHYATEWKEMHARLVRTTSQEHRARAKDEWFVLNHAQLHPSHDGLLGLAEHSVSANIGSGRPFGGVQPGLQYQEHDSSIHDSHEAVRPT